MWSPLKSAYFKDPLIGGENEGAYGSQYKYNHDQDDYWNNPAVFPRYTEYIEVEYKQAVFPLQVNVGSQRGSQQVVAIRAMEWRNGAKHSDWIPIFRGSADPEESAKMKDYNLYNEWAPPKVCRQPFKTKHLRIEIDTNTISEWNYIDYIKLVGATSLQNAIIQRPATSVLYVPNEHFNGQDSFKYAVTDCLGDSFKLPLSARKRSI